MPVTLPDDVSLVEETDIVSDFHYGVHVMRVHYRGDTELLGD